MGHDLENLEPDRVCGPQDEAARREIHRAGLLHGLVSGSFGLLIMSTTLLSMAANDTSRAHAWWLLPSLLLPLGATALVGRVCAGLLIQPGGWNVFVTGLSAGAVCSFLVPFASFLGALPFALLDANAKSRDTLGLLMALPIHLGAIGLVFALPIGLVTAVLLREKVRSILVDHGSEPGTR